MTNLVIDTSLAVKWLVNEKHSEQALQVLAKLNDGETELHAPEYLKIELHSVLGKYVLKQFLSLDLVKELLDVFYEIPLVFHSQSKESLFKAFNMALHYHISLYDAIFVQLGQELNARLITADMKLVNAINDKSKVQYYMT